MSTSEATPSSRATSAVKALLAASGTSQKALADHLGCATSQVSRRMKHNSWDLDDLGAIAEWFDVPLSVFIDRDALANAVSDLVAHAWRCMPVHPDGALTLFDLAVA